MSDETTPPSEEQLAEWEGLVAEAARVGSIDDWDATDEDVPTGGWRDAIWYVEDNARSAVASVALERGQPTARFLAAAGVAVPALLAEVRRLRAALEHP